MLLAESTGIGGATVVTMGLLSLPSMLKAGYDPRIACGTICASGTLGQVIPPSIVLVLLGDILQGANTEAQLQLGNFAPDPVSVVDLFAGSFLPGMILVGLRSEEHTSELQSLMRISYAVFCLKKKKKITSK